MSVTQNWSWIFSMNSTLYNQLRNLIYSKIVPSYTETPYNDSVISLNFNTLRTSISLSTDQQDVIQITAPISGNIQPDGGVQQPFNGTVSVQINLDKIYIKGDGSTSNTSGEQGITWTNFIYLESGAVSEVVVDTGDSSTDSTLTAFMQSNIDSYISNSPHSLGEMESANLDPYFVPTYQKFITLTDGSNSSNPRMIQLVMVNNEEPPTEDPHTAFNNTSTLDFPVGSNAVFAFNDYTVFDYVATKMEDSENNVFSDISVSENPAVLTAKGKKKSYSLKLTSQIENDTVATELDLSNAVEATIKYATSVDIVNETDGSQTLVVNNELTGSQVEINYNNAVVISLVAVYATLVALSPLHGSIYFSIMMTIQQRIISLVNKGAKKLEFENDIPLKSGTDNVGVTFMDITLDEGVIISANVSVSNSTSTETPMLKVKVTQGEMAPPNDLDEGLELFSKNMDIFHDGLVKEKQEELV